MLSNYDVLHLPFDIQRHKEHFCNYLEVIIRKDGTVEYAVPSHQEKLISICMEKYHVTRSELALMCPDDYFCDFMHWLCMKSECVPVWTNFYQGLPNKHQLETLKSLQNEGLYVGEVNIDYTRYYLDCIRYLDLDTPFYQLTDRQVHIVYCLQQIIENNYSLRKADKELCVPKSTLHLWIHKDIKHISISMYDELKAMMRSHIRN